MENTEGGALAPAGGKRLEAMDGLRGIAIALVVLYHLWPGISKPAILTILAFSGDLGVSLFFFISGFTIFYPYARTLVDGRRRESLHVFYLRRFAKIVPSYALSIAIAVVLGWAVVVPGTSLTTQLVAHALFIQNWFPATSAGINGVLWSMGVEVQFYLLFGLTLAFAMRSPKWYVAGLLAITFAYRLWLAIGLNEHQGILFDQLPANLDLFASGIACAYVYRRLATRSIPFPNLERKGTIAAIAGSIAMYAWLFVIRSNDPVHSNVGDALIRFVMPALFFITVLGTLFAGRPIVRLVANPITLLLMNISYNLYLWHQLIYNAALRRLPHATHSAVTVIALGSLALSIGIAMFLTKYFERPLMKRMRALERPSSLTVRVKA